MRLTAFTDHALRLLMMVAEAGDRLVTIEQAANRHRVSRANLMKVANKLTQAGLLEGVRGRSGGLRLARPADEIRIGEVVRATEPDFALVECFTTSDQCAITGYCRLPRVLSRAMAAFIAELDGTTLADVSFGAARVREPEASSASPAPHADAAAASTVGGANVTSSDMNSVEPTIYESPLRRAQVEDTRERILSALARILAESSGGDVLFDDVAKAAGVERRTVFRHFPNKDALLAAFWTWVDERTSPQALPRTLDDLVSLPGRAFGGFDRNEGIVRASLHSPTGRKMRLSALPARRAAFAKVVAEGLTDASADDRCRFEATAHLLYSPTAWETLKDYCAMSGEEAGATVGWALGTLIRAVREDATLSGDRRPDPDQSP